VAVNSPQELRESILAVAQKAAARGAQIVSTQVDPSGCKCVITLKRSHVDPGASAPVTASTSFPSPASSAAAAAATRAVSGSPRVKPKVNNPRPPRTPRSPRDAQPSSTVEVTASNEAEMRQKLLALRHRCRCTGLAITGTQTNESGTKCQVTVSVSWRSCVDFAGTVLQKLPHVSAVIVRHRLTEALAQLKALSVTPSSSETFCRICTTPSTSCVRDSGYPRRSFPQFQTTATPHGCST